VLQEIWRLWWDLWDWCVLFLCNTNLLLSVLIFKNEYPTNYYFQSPKKVIEDINNVGHEFGEGTRICVRLTVTGRTYKVELEPTAPMLLVKALKETDRNGGSHKGNISLEEIIQIARVLRPKSLAASFQGTVKEILGTAKIIVGITVNEQDPVEVIRSIESGEISVPTE